VGNDIPGERKSIVGLTQIKGIGYNFATAILDTLKINTNSNIGNLSDANIEAIEKLILDPIGGNFPTWFLNRNKDIETGADLHLLTSDIPFTLRNDIERERITASWRGYRHLSGLKVRGQRTRTSGRKGKRGDPGAPGADAAATTEDAAATTEDAAGKKEAPATAGKKEAPATGKKEAPATEKKEAPVEKKK